MRYDELISANDYDLKGKFDHYNKLCFGGQLPEIPLRFAKLKNLGGICGSQWIRQTSTLVPGSIYITLDKTYLRDEQSIDAILIHEMIHAWFYWQNDFREDHGMQFQAMRKKLSAIVGFAIPTTEKMENQVLADISIQRLVVFLRFPKNKSDKIAFFISTADYGKRKAPEYAAFWEASGPYYDARFVAYEIASPAWSQKAVQMRLQRPLTFRAATFYVLTDDALLDDLEANGTIIFDISKVA